MQFSEQRRGSELTFVGVAFLIGAASAHQPFPLSLTHTLLTQTPPAHSMDYCLQDVLFDSLQLHKYGSPQLPKYKARGWSPCLT